MKRIRNLVGMLVLTAVLLVQPGCQFLVGKAAVGVGKHMYQKVKEDRKENEQEKRERERRERDRREREDRDSQE